MPDLRHTDPAGSPAASRAGRRPASFDESLASIAEPAFGVAVCLARGEEAGAQLLTAAAVAAFRRFGELGTEADFRVWFFRILTQTYLGAREPEAVGGGADLDDTPDLLLYARTGAAGHSAGSADPAGRLLDALGPRRVMTAVTLLPEDYRLVCAYYFMIDLSYEEIAHVLDCPVGAVRARLHRGRKMLQKALWQIAEADGLTTLPGGDAR